MEQHNLLLKLFEQQCLEEHKHLAEQKHLEEFELHQRLELEQQCFMLEQQHLEDVIAFFQHNYFFGWGHVADEEMHYFDDS